MPALFSLEGRMHLCARTSCLPISKFWSTHPHSHKRARTRTGPYTTTRICTSRNINDFVHLYIHYCAYSHAGTWTHAETQSRRTEHVSTYTSKLALARVYIYMYTRRNLRSRLDLRAFEICMRTRIYGSRARLRLFSSPLSLSVSFAKVKRNCNSSYG